MDKYEKLDIKAMSFEELMKKYDNFIRGFCFKYVTDFIEYDDLYQEALLTLLSAQEKWDPERGQKFSFLRFLDLSLRSKMQTFCFGSARRVFVPHQVVKVKQHLIIAFEKAERSGVSLNTIVDYLILGEIGDIPNNLKKICDERKSYIANLAKSTKVTTETIITQALESILTVGSLNDALEVEDVIDDRGKAIDLYKSISKLELEDQLIVRKLLEGFSGREIADELYKYGLTDKVVTRQAVQMKKKTALDRLKFVLKVQEDEFNSI